MRRAPPPSAAAAWRPAHVPRGPLRHAPRLLLGLRVRARSPRPRLRHRPPRPSPRGRSGSGSGSTTMWPFWRTSRNRFSVEELRYLTDQLQKVHAVNGAATQDFVVEALRSIAELVIYGDQHDPSFFECFMEKQVMGEFARILRISNHLSSRVSLQLLQTMGIMIQNLKDEHSVRYILSSEHINLFITYPFDFRIDEMVSHYISFLRAISGKLNRDTISLLAKTEGDEVTSFPLYVEALKFAFHQDSMIRVAVRAMTLNVYHVGDESVNRFVSRVPLSDYFSDMVQHFQRQCVDLDKLVARSSGIADSSLSVSCCVEDAIVQIEDTLYYFSDVMSSGIPDLESFIADNIFQAVVFQLLLPSLQRQRTELDLSATTSMYLLCCILHILKNKDLASTVAAALFHQPDCPDDRIQRTPPNGYACEHDNCKSENHCTAASAVEQSNEVESNSLTSVSWKSLPNHSPPSNCCQGNTPREHLLSYITEGDDSQALGSLCLFATLLQTKELDESMLDALGILPQRKQHKKLLLQALVGEDHDEGQLFSSSSGLIDESIHSDFDIYVRKLQDKYGLQCHYPRPMTCKAHRYQVLDALVDIFCRSKVSADVRLVGGWLLWQLLPHGEEEFTAFHLRRLKDSHKDCTSKLSEEGGCWCDTDMLLPIIKEAWRNCKKEIEASSVAIAEGVYEIIKHCILATCRITKVDEDCPEGSPTKYLEYPPCISKDIETFCWCKQPMGQEEINTRRMEEYSHRYTFSSYKLQLLTVLNNCYKLQQLNMLNT